MRRDEAGALTDRWVRAWATSRRLPLEHLDGRPVVHVGGASRTTEVLCVEPDQDEIARWARFVAGDPAVMVTLLSRVPYDVAPAPSGLRLDRDDETLMSASLAAVRVPDPPAPLVLQWDVDGVRHTCRVLDGATVAAEGAVGVLGRDAVLDEVETSPRHRRRGLGRLVVAALVRRAHDLGATTGLLAATVDGRHLYSRLGWRSELSMLSYLGTPAPADVRNASHPG